MIPSTRDAVRINLPKFRGGPLSLLTCHDREVICVGPADSSKSYAACVKSYILCADPTRKGIHGAIVRKVFHSLFDSIIKTFDRVTAGLPVQPFGGKLYRERYLFPNGSELVPIGLDKPDKLLSSEWDFIQVCQAEELAESDWEMIASRCTGRGAVVRYPQVFGDCNPSGAKHWIRSRAKSGKLTLLEATHKDNPALYDDAGNKTPEGVRRLSALEATLTGVRLQRLFFGKWATSEGAIYEIFDTRIGGPHVMERNPGDMVRWFLALDEGFTNPAVILLVGEDPDGRWHVFSEYYERGKLQADVVAKAKEWHLEKLCELAAVDAAAAGLVADLLNEGIPAQAAKGRVLDGIAKVQERLKVQADGRARLTVDPSCVNTINEFESYVWKPGKDEPVKKDDHAMDALRYLADATEAESGLPVYESTDLSEEMWRARR